MNRIPVIELSPHDPDGVRRFVELERKLVGKNSLFVSEFDRDLIHHLSGKSAVFSEVEHSLFIAYDENQAVTRCAAIINHKYQQAKNEAVGMIGFLAAAPKCKKQVLAMLAKAESWLKHRGVQRIIAPFNANVMLGCGLLVMDYDQEPIITYGWNPPYYVDYMVAAGYQPTYPLLVYKVDLASPEFKNALDRARHNQAFQIRPIRKKHLHAELETFRTLINDNFINEWEWYPVTSAEFQEFFDPMKPGIDPHQMLIAEVEGKPAGVCIGLPNWSPLLRGFQGRLGMLQMLQFLIGCRRYQNAGLAFAAVSAEHRGCGMATALEVSVCQRYEQLGVKNVYGYTVNPDNLASRHVIESIGGTGRVMYQAYDKNLV